MDWKSLIALRLSELVAQKISSSPHFKSSQPEETLRKEIESEIQQHFQEEKQILQEVYQMMENLEQQGHDFERGKMFPLLKKQIAKKKGFPL